MPYRRTIKLLNHVLNRTALFGVLASKEEVTTKLGPHIISVVEVIWADLRYISQ